MGPLGEDGDQGIPQHCNFSQGVSGCQMSPSSRDLGCSLAEQQGSQEVRIQDVDIVNFNDCFLCNRQKLFLATFSNSSSDMVISYYFMLFHIVLISLCSLTSRSTSWSSGWPWNTAAFHALISDFQRYAEAMLAFLSIVNGLRLDDLDDLDDLEGVHRLWSFYVWMRPMPLWTRPEFLDAWASRRRVELQYERIWTNVSDLLCFQVNRSEKRNQRIHQDVVGPETFTRWVPNSWRVREGRAWQCHLLKGLWRCSEYRIRRHDATTLCSPHFYWEHAQV